MNLRLLTICAGLSLAAHSALLGLGLEETFTPPRLAGSTEISLVRDRRPTPPAPLLQPGSAPPLHQRRPLKHESRPAPIPDRLVVPPPSPAFSGDTTPPAVAVRADLESIVAAAPEGDSGIAAGAGTAEPTDPNPAGANLGSPDGAAASVTLPNQRLLPRPLDHPRPTYPPEALQRRWSGEVWLRLEVGADGRVTVVTVDRSSGYAVLDEAAARAVRGWRFAPAQRGDEAVASAVRLPVRFRLAGR